MAKIQDEQWLYRINDDASIKYLGLIKSVNEHDVMLALKPFLDKKKSYMYYSDQQMVAEYPDNVFRFGIVFCIKGIEEAGYCYRCGSRGTLIKTALVCPRCRSVIGGF